MTSIDKEHERINRHIGQKIKQLRINLGISQKQLGQLLEVTYQQAHKYESGANRISASSLTIIADKLGISPAYFFEGLDGSIPADKGDNNPQRLNLEVAKNFRNITNPRYQEAINILIRSLSE